MQTTSEQPAITAAFRRLSAAEAALETGITIEKLQEIGNAYWAYVEARVEPERRPWWRWWRWWRWWPRKQP